MESKSRIDFEFYMHYTDNPLHPTVLPGREKTLDEGLSITLGMRFIDFPTPLRVEAGLGRYGDDHAVLISCRPNRQSTTHTPPTPFESKENLRTEAVTLARRGNQHFWQRDYSKAVEFYTASLEKCLLATTLVYRGEAYIHLHRFDLAHVDSANALGLDKFYTRAHECRRKVLILQKKPDAVAITSKQFNEQSEQQTERLMRAHQRNGLTEEGKALLETDGGVVEIEELLILRRPHDRQLFLICRLAFQTRLVLYSGDEAVSQALCELFSHCRSRIELLQMFGVTLDATLYKLFADTDSACWRGGRHQLYGVDFGAVKHRRFERLLAGNEHAGGGILSPGMLSLTEPRGLSGKMVTKALADEQTALHRCPNINLEKTGLCHCNGGCIEIDAVVEYLHQRAAYERTEAKQTEDTCISLHRKILAGGGLTELKKKLYEVELYLLGLTEYHMLTSIKLQRFKADRRRLTYTLIVVLFSTDSSSVAENHAFYQTLNDEMTLNNVTRESIVLACDPFRPVGITRVTIRRRKIES